MHVETLNKSFKPMVPMAHPSVVRGPALKTNATWMRIIVRICPSGLTPPRGSAGLSACHRMSGQVLREPECASNQYEECELRPDLVDELDVDGRADQEKVKLLDADLPMTDVGFQAPVEQP